MGMDHGGEGDVFVPAGLSRREFLQRCAALGISLPAGAALLAACGGSSGRPSATTATTAAGANPAAVVRMAAAEDTWPAQGKGAKSSTYAYPLNVNVYEPLIYLASDYSLQPGLATSWELVPPGTWRFHLRQGVTFHDGRPFTADDVMWTWGVRQAKGKTLSTVEQTLGPSSVHKVDQFTVDFVPKIPNLRLPEQIVHPEGAIVPTGSDFDSQPAIGTGPFKVVSYAPGQTCVVERNDAYWGPKARVQRLALQFLPDPQARVQALQAGNVDFVIDLPPGSVQTLRGAGDRVVLPRPGENHLIYLNKTGQAPHDLCADAHIRHAIASAVDTHAYVTAVYDGNAQPGHWMAPASVLGPSAALVPAPTFDLAVAKSTLEQDGWVPGSDGIRAKAGRRLSLDLIGAPDIPAAAFEVLQSQLKAAGIAITIKQAADTPAFQNLYKNTDFDLDLEDPNQNDGNPAFLPVLRMYSKNPATQRFAPGGQFDVLAGQALMATSTAEVQQLSAEMMKILITDDAIVIPLAGVSRIYGMSAKVNLADPHPSQTNQLWVSLTST